jgi:hypothetical protein
MIEQEVKESIYKNPLMEKYQVDGQMDIFAYLPEDKNAQIPSIVKGAMGRCVISLLFNYIFLWCQEQGRLRRRSGRCFLDI